MRKLNFSFVIINLFFLFWVGMYVKNEYYLSLVIYILFNAINASCLNVLLGYAGIISLGQAAFFGIGAYSSGILTATYGINPYLTIIIGVILSAVIALIIGYPALKLHGHYLAMATLGFGMIVYICFNEMDFLTGGPSGLTGIPDMSFFGFLLDDEYKFFVFMGAVYMLFLFLMEMFDKSFLSYKLRFIHESENASSSYGIDVAKTKLTTFVVVACITSINGSLFAFYSNFVSPVSFSFHYSVEMLVMAVFGGLGSITGGTIGAAILTSIPEIFAEIEDYEVVIYGVILAVTILFLDGGIAKLCRRLAGKYVKSE
ncbi:branched-chain amino acid ABC transporter permease [Deferribacteraceae bacterium V6Fe1]|nr:branched-chain amino acid ABC transporter permease [Deferribacteraceae bacterium V6Fe1]